MNINKLKKYLKWYHNDSASVLGMRSNFNTILNTSYGTIPFMENDNIFGALPKIHQHRLIHQALQQLSRHQLRLLSALYSDEYQNKYPLVIKHVFLEKTGLALCFSYDLEQLLDLCTKHRHASLSLKETSILNNLLKTTEDNYNKLHKHLQYDSYIMELK